MASAPTVRRCDCRVHRRNDQRAAAPCQKGKVVSAIAEDKLRRLYQMVEEDITDPDDLLKDRIATLKATRDRARASLDRIKANGPSARLDAETITRFGALMRENITSGEIPFWKAYLRSLIDAVEVGDRSIRIVGSKSVLEQAVLAKHATHPGVRSAVRKWRTIKSKDENWRLRRAFQALP